MINAIRQLIGIGRGWYQYGLGVRRYWYCEFLLLGVGDFLNSDRDMQRFNIYKFI